MEVAQRCGWVGFLMQRCGCRCPARCCPTHCCGSDIDDIFAYTAAKSVIIKDHKLGMAHYLLLICIAVYILVYQLLCNLGYLKFDDARNSVRLTLQQPTNSCNPNKPDCKDSFTALSHLNYCCAANASCQINRSDGSCSCDYRPAFKNYNCTYLDGAEAANVQQTSILVTTAIHQYNQSRNKSCYTDYPAGAGTCDKVWLSNSDVVVFSADVEAFTILIDHVVMGPGPSPLAITSRQMQGVLYVGSGSELQQRLCADRTDAIDSPFGGQLTDSSPCYLPPKKVNGLDTFTVGELIQAMGVSLDIESYNGSGHSARYDGIVANLIIEYSNTEAWKGRGDVRYIYKPAAVPQSDYENSRFFSTSFPDKRVKWSVRGLLLEVQASGRLATFSFTAMLLQLTTSLTLLAMSTVVVNILAQRVLENRKFYQAAMFDCTGDFSDINRVQTYDSFQLNEALASRTLATGGPRHARVMRLLADGWTPPQQAPLRAASAPAQHAQQTQLGGTADSLT